MIKDLKLGLGLGVGFWVIMFIGVSALMVIPMSVLIQQIGGIVLAGLAAFLLAKIYFGKHPGDIKAALVLGVAWFIVVTILDLLLTIQYVKAGASYVNGLKIFYSMWNVWVGFLLMFAGIIGAAQTTHGGELMKKPSDKPPVSPPSSSPPPPPPPPKTPSTPPPPPAA